MESFVSPKCCLVDWFHQYFFCLVRVPAKSVTSLQLKLYFMIRKRQLFPFVFFLLMGSFFPRGRLLNRTCFYYFDANFADAITSRHQKLSRCNPAFKDSTSVLAYHSRCFSQTSWLRNATALPQTLEELKEILAKDKDQVDEELWRNAIKVWHGSCARCQFTVIQNIFNCREELDRSIARITHSFAGSAELNSLARSLAPELTG